jgi:hypothetical protein
LSEDAALWPLPRLDVKAGCGKPLEALSNSTMSKAEDERAKRLAEALRQNLRRRKAQARGDAGRDAGDGDEKG